MSLRVGDGHNVRMQALEPGTLLVATPALMDSNFDGSVVLLVDFGGEGALGVVLNRVSDVDFPPAIEDWRTLASHPAKLFVGGPVGQDSALAIGMLRSGVSAPPGFAGFAGSLGLVDLDAPPELLTGALSDLRVFAGYAGWGGGQLEGEIEEGSWYVVPAQEADVFRPSTASLRRDVLRRQPGQLAWHATRPADPELN